MRSGGTYVNILMNNDKNKQKLNTSLKGPDIDLQSKKTSNVEDYKGDSKKKLKLQIKIQIYKSPMSTQ